MSDEIPVQSVNKLLAAAAFFMIAGGYVGIWYHHLNSFDVQLIPIILFFLWAGGAGTAFAVSALNGIEEARES